MFLTDLSGLEQLTSVGGDLRIEYNPLLTSLNGLGQLTSVGGELRFDQNPLLNSLNGIEQLTSVGKNLEIIFNNILTNLNGLNQLTSIGGNSLWIEHNNSLLNLDGLDSLDYTTISYLIIRNNDMLSDCGAQVVCDYLENGGPYTVTNNNDGCNAVWGIYESCGLLPIEMASPLQVHLNNQTALLKWQTATETNNEGFEIQRSRNVINWEKIDWQVGQGTTTTSHTYIYVDTKPFFGTSYYRLKQVDFDGQFEYSNIVSLHNKTENIIAYPVPSEDFVVFDVPNTAEADEIILYDISGKQISRQDFPQDKQLAVSHLNDGVYIYRIFYADEMYSGKIVVE